MNISEFKAALGAHSDSALVFAFDDGDTIPAHFHVTEVGHVVRDFIDCGGVRRTSENCTIQAWVAETDPEHRLSPAKLGQILELARPLLASDDLDVEIEYEQCVLSQYRVTGYELKDGALRFTLEDKHTDCLAKEVCGAASGCNTGACCS
ncbi:MAG TPA: DUF6428 family protein [Phycisphaerae bacterium]|nr:DUF6428 family protein [Phycisphaerae bacterium]